MSSAIEDMQGKEGDHGFRKIHRTTTKDLEEIQRTKHILCERILADVGNSQGLEFEKYDVNKEFPQ